MQAVTAILILGAIASLVAWVILLLLEHGIRPVHSMVHFVRRLPWSGRLVVLPLFAALVVYGSVKNHSNERGEMSNEIGSESVSNRVDRVEGDESGFNAEAQSRGDAQRGKDGDFYRAGESGFDGLVGNAVISEDWLKFGGYEDWIYVGPGAWSFRYGSNFVERLAVFSSGKIRLLKQDGGDAWIALSAVPVSIVPEANWGMLNFRCRDVGEGEGQGEGVVVGVGGESGFGRVERVDGGESDYLAQSPQSSQSGDLDNVANVEMLPIANTNTNSQFETGTVNWQHSHTGNIQQLLWLNGNGCV